VPLPEVAGKAIDSEPGTGDARECGVPLQVLTMRGGPAALPQSQQGIVPDRNRIIQDGTARSSRMVGFHQYLRLLTST
jgi:hypothetical protein